MFLRYPLSCHGVSLFFKFCLNVSCLLQSTSQYWYLIIYKSPYVSFRFPLYLFAINAQCQPPRHFYQDSFTQAPPIHPFPPTPRIPDNHWFFLTVSIGFSFPKCHVVGIIYCVAYSQWLRLLSNMHLRFVHVFWGLNSSFLFIGE